jgi:predicted translin family RNA/ssDNA-binding protein
MGLNIARALSKNKIRNRSLNWLKKLQYIRKKIKKVIREIIRHQRMKVIVYLHKKMKKSTIQTNKIQGHVKILELKVSR